MATFKHTPVPASLRVCALLTAAAGALLAGCNSAPAVTDASLTQSVQAQLGSDHALAGLPIQASVAGSVATLTGSVTNDAQRTIAARDAAAVPGLRQVINNLYIASPAPAAQAGAGTPDATNRPASITPPAPVRSTRTLPPVKLEPAPRSVRQPAPVVRSPQPSTSQPAYTSATASNQPAPLGSSSTPVPPVFRTVTLPSGSAVPVRITQTLDSATTQPDSTFSGVVASDIIVDGITAFAAGTPVSGHVDAVQEAAHFKGSSLLTVSLSTLGRRGDRSVAVSTEPYTVEGKGRGQNTAVKTGGGAAVGAILGGIFGGGKGAAIGAATGGGLGAGSNAITRGEQVQIPSESVVRFRLAAPVAVKVRTDVPEPQSDPTLQRRPQNLP